MDQIKWVTREYKDVSRVTPSGGWVIRIVHKGHCMHDHGATRMLDRFSFLQDDTRSMAVMGSKAAARCRLGILGYIQNWLRFPASTLLSKERDAETDR